MFLAGRDGAELRINGGDRSPRQELVPRMTTRKRGRSHFAHRPRLVFGMGFVTIGL